MPDRIAWQEATVVRVVEQTPTVKSFFFKAPHWANFRAGQHVDIRLSAPDGYMAERSYSIGSAPDESGIFELVVERLDDGEVSPFFHDVVAVGDTIELRGPIGGHFVWRPEDGGPVLLIGGGSGVVPLMAMLRLRAAAAPEVPMALIYSARTLNEVIFREELMRRATSDPGFSLFLALTRETAPIGDHRIGRIDADFTRRALSSFAGAKPRLAYVCGATAFVEVATMFLLDAGMPASAIRTERYGGAPAPEFSPSMLAPEV